MKSSNIIKNDIDVWGGVECTVNRVGDVYFDQLIKNGHHDRLEDLNLFSELGISAIRYPVLWERVAPDGLDKADWTWSDERLEHLRNLQVRPIVGLLHHGSGPPDTSLVDPKFPEKFAAYASAVAARYPWIEDYTPINEPLTTARFSGLYGFWYPHERNDRAFLNALLNQCRATVLAMRAIRKINPRARLIQTEDLGKTYSTPKLEYQSRLENERRWLTFDLLCGRLNRRHPMWKYARKAGVEDSRLEWFTENLCLPDIIGFNYYLTSERFLDERVENYPGLPVGGNRRDSYVDVEAIRVNIEAPTGLRVLMHEAWTRYKLPIAITEAHLGCTREEQLRWFAEVWETAHILKGEGVDLRAVTAWSLLGSYDWNSLLTEARNYYEPGAFDVRGHQPRPTALARLIKSICYKQKYEHPAITGSGWWKRHSRFITQAETAQTSCAVGDNVCREKIQSVKTQTKQLLIIGADEKLGEIFGRVCETRGLSYHLLSLRETDISDAQSVEAAVIKYNPWAIVNTADCVRAVTAAGESELCFPAGAKGAVNLAEICERNKISYLAFSIDAEKQILEINPNALVVRTAASFNSGDDFNFWSVALDSIFSEKTFEETGGDYISPTRLPDLVNACLDILIDGESGLWHLTNQGLTACADFACGSSELNELKSLAVAAGLTADLSPTAKNAADKVIQPHYI